MDQETKGYESRNSSRTFCTHCGRDTEHKCVKDPNLKQWVEICLVCEMVELADDELSKIGKSYEKASKGNRRGIA